MTSPLRERLREHRDDVLCGAAIVALALYVAWPLFTGDALFYGDFDFWFLPARRLLSRELLAGHAPLWNPHLALGTPLLGNPLVGATYPLALIQLLGDDRTWLGLTVPLHLAIGGLSTYALARSFGARPVAALVAGVAMSAGAIPLAGAENLYTLWSLAWLPLAFLALDQALARRSTSWAVAAGAAVALVALGGDVARLVDVALSGVALLTAHTLSAGSRGPRRLVSLAALCLVAAVTSALLAAVMLLPALELLARSSRLGGIAPAVIHQMPLHPLQLLGFALRAPVGRPLPINSLFGDALIHYERLWYVSLYPGLAAGLFAPFAFARRAGAGVSEVDRSRQLVLRAAGVLALVFLLLSLGGATPFSDVALRVCPPLRLFRFPAKYAGSLGWLVPLLGAVGLERVLRAPGLRRSIALGIAALLAVAGLTLAGCSFRLAPLIARSALVSDIAGPATAQLRADGIHLAVVATLLALALALVGRARVAGVAVLAAALLFDGARAGPELLWTAPCSQLADVTPFADALRVAAPSRVVRFPASPALLLHKDLAGWNQLSKAMIRRLDWDAAAGEGVDALTQYADLQIGEVKALRDALLYTDAHFPFAELLATDHQIVANEVDLPRSLTDRVSAGSLVEVMRTTGRLSATLYRDVDALPRAAVFRAASLAPASSRPAVARRLLRETDIRRVAIVDETDVLEDGRASSCDVRALLTRAGVPLLDPAHPDASLAPAEPAVVSFPSATETIVRAHADAPSLLVLADVFYPGWHADVDGREAPIIRASLVGRGVVLSAGDHVVTFRYRPRSFAFGAGVSFVTWGTVLALGAMAALRQRRRGRRPQDAPLSGTR